MQHFHQGGILEKSKCGIKQMWLVILFALNRPHMYESLMKFYEHDEHDTIGPIGTRTYQQCIRTPAKRRDKCVSQVCSTSQKLHINEMWS